jgi:hypothetical protein
MGSENGRFWAHVFARQKEIRGVYQSILGSTKRSEQFIIDTYYVI